MLVLNMTHSHVAGASFNNKESINNDVLREVEQFSSDTFYSGPLHEFSSG